LFFAIVGALVAISITILPYRLPRWIHQRDMRTMDDLKKVRPVLSQDELYKIMGDTMHAETQFWLPEPSNDRIKLRFHRGATKEGNHQPPELFYSGVVYGLTAYNSHELEFSRDLPMASFERMGDVLLNMKPTPTSLMQRSASNNVTGWIEPGYAVYFSYDDLKKQGKLSTNVLSPWSRVEEDILAIARDFKQVCFFRWSPYRFGADVKGPGNRHIHESVIQHVVPTRTGLDELKSSVVVWMSQVNGSNVERQWDVVEREWTDEDHWTAWLGKTN
jgi:hypothetical protein